MKGLDSALCVCYWFYIDIADEGTRTSFNCIILEKNEFKH